MLTKSEAAFWGELRTLQVLIACRYPVAMISEDQQMACHELGQAPRSKTFALLLVLESKPTIITITRDPCVN